jgi:hypothetical protein
VRKRKSVHLFVEHFREFKGCPVEAGSEGHLTQFTPVGLVFGVKETNYDVIRDIVPSLVARDTGYSNREITLGCDRGRYGIWKLEFTGGVARIVPFPGKTIDA